MTSIKEAQKQIIEDFKLLPAWDDKYSYLIELGQELAPMNPDFKNEENLVKGCQSNIWFHTRCEDGILTLEADSDSLIVKGIASMLVKVLSGHSPQEVLDADLTFIDTIGMRQHLSSQRSSGLIAMLEHIRKFASACTG